MKNLKIVFASLLLAVGAIAFFSFTSHHKAKVFTNTYQFNGLQQSSDWSDPSSSIYSSGGTTSGAGTGPNLYAVIVPTAGEDPGPVIKQEVADAIDNFMTNNNGANQTGPVTINVPFNSTPVYTVDLYFQ